MRILHLELSNFRNIHSTKLDFGDNFNIFFGNNGAGKTSLLEAIYFLSVGKSFRSQYPHHLIAHDHDKFTIFSYIKNEDGSEIPIGIERQSDNVSRIRIAGENTNTHSQITKLTPIQLIAAKDYRLLELGPEYRRQFLDWGVFHVEHSFLNLWQKTQQAIRQRNALLKVKPTDKKQINFWDQELEKTGTELHVLRENYLSILKPLFNNLATTLLGNIEISLEYYAGWDTNQSLQEVLSSNLEKDLRFGFTTSGTHRADIRLKTNNCSAQDILSRGQQKLLLYALRLAQGQLLKQQKNVACAYLIDDLPSELDNKKCLDVINILSEMNSQVFITGINRDSFSGFLDGKNAAMFHVEHGKIFPI